MKCHCKIKNIGNLYTLVEETQPCFLSVGHGTLPHLCGNLGDVLVSGLLQKCYRSSQNLPRVYEQYGTAPIQPISTEMLILLTVYYLVQLGENNSI